MAGDRIAADRRRRARQASSPSAAAVTQGVATGRRRRGQCRLREPRATARGADTPAT
ncbi:MAG: hypothetical protein AVDCRST_MAG49-3556 [uncultured Thermomicrobiales bacterium]|uniref:Uncharacterized protein n=1 Tax=uncultured Thermomicrobiales bacterium TaxID=1645740 RepID=A0A6J4VA77_9BACT|nr:MAG: hypothetical protein AVDCRST_MAG49-3556 [uncultured Thermomicrobiales bacterium]